MKFLISLFLFLSLSTPILASERYIALIIGSKHVGYADLNDFNPGLTYGHRWERSNGFEWHMEGGLFYNSYEEIAPIFMAGASIPLYTISDDTQFRVGLSTGIGYYPTLAPQLKDTHGIPNINGFIPLAAATVSLRHNDFEYRVTAVPPGVDVKAIFNLSIAYSF